MSIDVLLSRFDIVKATGRNQYQARCPAHDDSSPSLSIGIGADGRVLVRDHGGCDTGDVLSAVGLTYKDLFPDQLRTAERRAMAKRATRDELERALFRELYILSEYVGERFVSRQLERDKTFRHVRPEWMPFPDDHYDRELLAVKRIRKGLGVLYG